MLHNPFPKILPYHLYCIIVYMGFFAWKFPFVSVLLAGIFYFFSGRIRCIIALPSFLFGFFIAFCFFWETAIPPPAWYTSGNTYTLEATVEAISYKTNKRTEVILSNISATHYIDIQKISKKKPCTIQKNGMLLYTKARSCAVIYPLEKTLPLPKNAVWTSKDVEPNVLVGQKISGIFTIYSVNGVKNLHGFSIESFWKEKGVHYRVTHKMGINTVVVEGIGSSFSRIRNYLRTALNKELQHSVSKDTITTDKNAIIQALLLGDRYYFTSKLEKSIAQAGLLHSLVLSGLHLSCLFIIVYPILLGILFFFPTILLYIPRSTLDCFAIAFIAMLYAISSGFPISFMRALLMLIVLLFFSVLRIRTTLLDLVLYTVAILFCFNPTILYSLSFQLSVGAVIAIYFTLPFVRSYTAYIKHFALSWAIEYFLIIIGTIFIISSSIQIVLLPFTLTIFGTTSQFFILNILWLPVLSFFVLPFLLVSFILSLFGFSVSWLWTISSYPIEALLRILSFLEGKGFLYTSLFMRPHIFTSIALYLALYAFLLIYVVKTTKNVKYLVSLSILFLSIPIGIRLYNFYDTTLIIRMLDVGRGQAILIEEGAKRILIDAGNRAPTFDVGEKILSPLLTRNYFPKLDSIILSHQDTDHMGGSIYLGNYYDIGTIYYNGDSEARTETIKDLLEVFSKNTTKIVKEGDIIPISKNTYMKVLLPNSSSKESASSNAKSIVLMLVQNNKNIALILGDIDIVGQKYIVEKYGKALECLIVVVPHHGSRHNLYIPLYTATKATIALVSTHKVDHNFLGPTVKKALEEAGMKIYSTYVNGELSIRSKNGILSVVPAVL